MASKDYIEYWVQLERINKYYSQFLKLFIAFHEVIGDNPETIKQAKMLLDLLESKPSTHHVPKKVELLAAAEGRLSSWVREFFSERLNVAHM